MATPAQIVEGEWKNFVFKMIKPTDSPAIFEHLREYFMKDELMVKLAGIDDAYVRDFQGFCTKAFEEDLSFMAFDKETNELAGVRITFTNYKEAEFLPSGKLSKTTEKILQLIYKLESEAKVWEKYGIDRLANFLAASTATKYRGQGLATEMYRRSIDLLRSTGHPLCKSAFSSPFTRKAVGNLGFEEIARVYLKDFHDDNGKPNFPNCKDDDCVTYTCLKL